MVPAVGFTIDSILGAGAYAVVCSAHTRGGELRALKVLRSAYCSDVRVVERFVDEGQMLAQLAHPGLVAVQRVFHLEGRPVLEMELVQGVDLATLCAAPRAGLPARVALQIALEIALALEYAHEACGPDGEPLRIVHRDVKPANILLDVSGRAKLVDFGIAKGTFDSRRAKSLFMVPSSAGFEPPERRLGAEDTPAVDVYGLGVVLFTVLTSRTLLVRNDPAQHDAYIERQLQQLELDHPEPKRVIWLLRTLTRARPSERPTIAAAAAALRELVGPASESSLAAFAAEEIEGLVDARAATDPRKSEDWPEIAFLEEADLTTAGVPLTPEQARARVEAVLQRPDWFADLPALQLLLHRAGAFEPSPFLRVLDRARVPWWMPWRRAAEPEELEAALLILCDHPGPQLVDRARALLGHDDPRVQAAARFVVSSAGG